MLKRQTVEDVVTGSEIVHQTRLRFETATRHYSVTLTRDLLGDIFVEQKWGGKFNRRGNGMKRQVATVEDGIAVLEAIKKRRRQRGYTICNA